MYFPFIFIIQLILFISINNQENNTLEFKGVYTIQSLYNNYSIAEDNFCLQFYDPIDKIPHLFRIIKNENNTSYYIEKRNTQKRIGVNKIGHVLTVFNPRDRNYINTTEWNIIKIGDNKYIIQNTNNFKFIEIHNNYIQCINDLPFPIEEHISEISSVFIFSINKLYDEVEFNPSYEEIINEEPIDVVIKYIDLSDVTLDRKGIIQIQKDEDNEELRYSVRSILQYIPWIRKIFIVMPNEKVKYFKSYDQIKEKIVYVKDKDVLGFDSANIYAFTFNLFRLEKFGLSNNFIYMDDDFFIGKELNKSNFFYYEEKEKRVVPSLLNNDFNILNKEIIYAKYDEIYAMKDNITNQCFQAWNFSLLSTEKFFLDFYSNMTIVKPTPSHNAISYNIQDLKEIYDLVVNNYKYANETLYSIERHILTLQTQHFVDLYEFNIKQRKVNSIKANVYPMNLLRFPNFLNVELFAINTGGDRNYTKYEYYFQKEIMKIRFPNPTPYEIVERKTNFQNNFCNYINFYWNNDDKKKNDNKNENITNPLEYNFEDLTKPQFNNLIENYKKKEYIIEIYFWLLILMTILIMILVYFLYSSKNINSNKYDKLTDNETKKKLEII